MEQREWRRVEVDNLDYTIEELVEQPEPYTFDHPLTIMTYFVSWSLWAVYLTCRYRNLPLLTQATAASWWLSGLMLLTEILLLLPAVLSALHMSLYIFFGTRNKHRSSYRLAGKEAPTIDVCITCCGEKLDVIMDTVAGAAMQDYPSACFRVFVLDDGGDAALKDAVGDYNRSHGTSVEYLARTKLAGESHFYKAGNLRFGLETTENVGKGSEYFASLDVDMIAEPDWLRRVVPHLILDSKMALACPAQVWKYQTKEACGCPVDANINSGITTFPTPTCSGRPDQHLWRSSNRCTTTLAARTVSAQDTLFVAALLKRLGGGLKYPSARTSSAPTCWLGTDGVLPL
jgi:hypothetical protein